MADESIWKKEITFGRKKKAPAQHDSADSSAKAEHVPFWKKEIGGKKKTKPEAPVETVAVPAPVPQPVPFWKKEITLGGSKPQAPQEPKTGGEVPFWKRDVFAPKTERLNDADATAFLKKEISFTRKQQPEVERLAEEATQAFAPTEPELHEPIKAAEAAAAALIADPNAEIEIFFQAPRSRPEPEPEFEPAVEPEPEPEPEPVVPEPVAEVEPGLEPLPEPPPLELGVSQPVLPAPAFEAEPPAPAAPVELPAPVVYAPVPAAELPHEPKVPFWKKEIGAKKKPAVAAAAAPAADEATVATPFWRKKIEIGRRPVRGDGATEEVSIWKKEITFSRKPKEAAATSATATAAEPNVPFWKKEVSFSRKPKEAPASTTVVAAVAGDEPKVPFWKKEIGGKKKPVGATQAKAPKARAAKGDAVPFWKKELSLKSLKETQVSLPSRSTGGARGKTPPTKAKRLVGLKVGASQIAAARVVNNGVAELVQVARQPLEQGIVVGGELRDPDALAVQLKAFFARNKLPKKNVRLGIASNRIGVRIFDVAGIQDENQLANAIQFRAQEALPIPLDEAVLDYHVLSEGVDAEGQPTRRILLVVAYRELVDRYVSACKKAGISLLGVDLEAFALLRALAAPRPEGEPAKAALVGVAIGHDRSTFAVSDGRVCEFTRVLEWGGAALNVAMARALDLAPSEVESYKRALMLDGPAPVPDGLTQEQWAAALDAVRRQLQSFARELVSSLQFYQNQPGSLGIGEIVLAGGTAHMPGLAEELQRLIGVHVRVGDPLARVKVTKKVAEAAQIGSLAVAIGLGIED